MVFFLLSFDNTIHVEVLGEGEEGGGEDLLLLLLLRLLLLLLLPLHLCSLLVPVPHLPRDDHRRAPGQRLLLLLRRVLCDMEQYKKIFN